MIKIKMRARFLNKNLTFAVLSLIFGLVIISNISAIENTVFIDDYEINYMYVDASDGEKFTLTVTVTNSDNEAKEDVVFELQDTRPFDIDSDKTWDIGFLEEDQSVTKNFRVEVDEGTLEGDYDLEFQLEDSDEDYEDEFEIEVMSDKADIIVSDVTSSPIIIGPDMEDIKIEVTLENIGGGDANFLRTKLVLPDGFSSSSSFSNTFNIGTIAAKESKVATFFIDSDKSIASGISIAEIELEYKTDVELFERTIELELPVKGRPLYDVVSSRTEPKELSPGDIGQLFVRVQNVGEEKGDEVSVRVFENTDHPFEFDEKTNFIGNLDSGEAGTAIFKVEVDDNANENDYIVKIQVRSVNRGDVLVSEHTVPLDIVLEERDAGNGLTISILFIVMLIILIILIILFIIVLMRRGGKRDIEDSFYKSDEEF